MNHNKQKKLAVINDFCGFGRCSLAASLPIISALKIQCCPLPTAIFSNHTGFESFHFTDYTTHMVPYIEEWKKLGLHFNGILTGFLGSPEQINIVKAFLKYFKSGDTVAVIDPVMGDYGKLYKTYSPKLAEKMQELLPFADILTPNLTEACILANVPYKESFTFGELYEICKVLSRLGPEKIVISGIENGNSLENFVFIRGCEPVIIKQSRVGGCRSGTGDVFSSIIAADAVNGRELIASVEHASSFIARALKRTEELDIPKTDGICFEELLTEINGSDGI